MSINEESNMSEENCPYCGNDHVDMRCDECGDMYCDECIVRHEVTAAPKRIARDTGKPLLIQRYLCPNCDGRAESDRKEQR